MLKYLSFSVAQTAEWRPEHRSACYTAWIGEYYAGHKKLCTDVWHTLAGFQSDSAMIRP